MSRTAKVKQQKNSSKVRTSRSGAYPFSKRKITKAAAADAESPRQNSKLATMITMLERKDGATLAEMTKATGWQAHSVRGAMSGALKKKRGLAVSSIKDGQTRSYRIA